MIDQVATRPETYTSLDPRTGRPDLGTLALAHEHPVLSLYMPVVQVQSQAEQNSIRFGNLIREAERQLGEAGYTDDQVKAILKPARELGDRDIEAWLDMAPGLAVFAGPDYFETFQMQCQFDEHVSVGRVLHLLPIIAGTQLDGRFAILALSRGGSRLYDATGTTIREVMLEDVPMSLDEELKYDDFEQHLQHHTAKGRSRTQSDAAFHGQGGEGDDANQKKQVQRFLEHMENGVTEWLEQHNIPLIIAGDPTMRGYYRQVNGYEYVTDEEITVNPNGLTEQELHLTAWDALAPIFKGRLKQALENYQILQANEPSRASDNLRTIVPAAHFQRVETLLVDPDARTTGSFDPDTNTISEFEDGENLVDLAIAGTLRNGGTVFSTVLGRTGDSSMVAVLRY